MKCKDVRKMLSDYIDGQLDAAVRAEMRTHLAACRGCLHELLVLRASMDRLLSLRKLRAPDDFLESVYNRLELRVPEKYKTTAGKRALSWQKISAKYQARERQVSIKRGLRAFGKTLFTRSGIKLPLEFAAVAAAVIAAIFVFNITGPKAGRFAERGAALEKARLLQESPVQPPESGGESQPEASAIHRGEGVKTDVEPLRRSPEEVLRSEPVEPIMPKAARSEPESKLRETRSKIDDKIREKTVRDITLSKKAEKEEMTVSEELKEKSEPERPVYELGQAEMRSLKAAGKPADEKSEAERAVKQPEAGLPEADALVAGEPAIYESEADKSAAAKIEADESAADKSAADKSAFDKLTADELAADESAVQLPAREQPAEKRPSRKGAAKAKQEVEQPEAERPGVELQTTTRSSLEIVIALHPEPGALPLREKAARSERAAEGAVEPPGTAARELGDSEALGKIINLASAHGGRVVSVEHGKEPSLTMEIPGKNIEAFFRALKTLKRFDFEAPGISYYELGEPVTLKITLKASPPD